MKNTSSYSIRREIADNSLRSRLANFLRRHAEPSPKTPQRVRPKGFRLICIISQILRDGQLRPRKRACGAQDVRIGCKEFHAVALARRRAGLLAILRHLPHLRYRSIQARMVLLMRDRVQQFRCARLAALGPCQRIGVGSLLIVLT